MSDTITVTVQRGNGAASAQTLDFSSDEAPPLPPTWTRDAELDTGSASPPPDVDEDDASAGELSASETPTPPGFDEDASDGEEGTNDDSSAPSPPEA